MGQIAMYPAALTNSLCDEIIKSLVSEPNRENYSQLVTTDYSTADTFYTDNSEISQHVKDAAIIALMDYLKTNEVQLPIEAFELRDVSPVENSKGLPDHNDPSIITKNGVYLLRPLILLAFLNDNYFGGELVFPKHNKIVNPQQGMLCIFPAHFLFRHLALPATDLRYVLRIEFTINKKYWTSL